MKILKQRSIPDYSGLPDACQEKTLRVSFFFKKEFQFQSFLHSSEENFKKMTSLVEQITHFDKPPFISDTNGVKKIKKTPIWLANGQLANKFDIGIGSESQ